MCTFNQFKLADFCNQVINELGFKKPTAIQEKVIPLIKKNKDVIGISQTGTGKTHAFLLPIMDKIGLKAPENNKHAAPVQIQPQNTYTSAPVNPLPYKNNFPQLQTFASRPQTGLRVGGL